MNRMDMRITVCDGGKGIVNYKERKKKNGRKKNY